MLRVLRLYLKVAIFQPELREHAPHTTSVLKDCDFPPGAAGAHSAGVCSAYYDCTQKLRFSSLSCGSTLRTLRLYLKVPIFQPELQEHAPRTTFVLKSCDFQAGAAADQGESNPRPRDCESRRANHETTSKGRLASKNICTAPQRERFDAHNLRRGFAETKTNSHGATARALRRTRSPQRVARGQQKS